MKLFVLDKDLERTKELDEIAGYRELTSEEVEELWQILQRSQEEIDREVGRFALKN